MLSPSVSPIIADSGEPSAPSAAVSRDETAFALVVETFSRLVFSTALRQLGGDAESAREVTQNVFLTAFRKQDILAGVKFPAAWFHRAAMLESSNFLRVESRRRKYLEAWAAEQSVVDDEASAGLSEVLRAQLDEALHGLREPDRELVLGRFFEGRSFQELAEHHRSTPDAVRMKLTRILDKLATVLKRRGAAVTIAALASALGCQWSEAAPAGLGAAVAATAKTGTAVTASQLNTILAIMTSGKSVVLAIGVIVLGLTSLGLQSARIKDLKSKLETRSETVMAASKLAPANLPGVLTKKDAYDIYGRPLPDTTPVSAPLLLAQIREAVRVRQMSQIFISANSQLEKMDATQLQELLAGIDIVPGGASLKYESQIASDWEVSHCQRPGSCPSADAPVPHE